MAGYAQLNKSWTKFQLDNYWSRSLSKGALSRIAECNLNIVNDDSKLCNNISSNGLPLLIGVDMCNSTPVYHGVMLTAGRHINLLPPLNQQGTTTILSAHVMQSESLVQAVDSLDFTSTIATDETGISHVVKKQHDVKPSQVIHADSSRQALGSVGFGIIGTEDTDVKHVVQQQNTEVQKAATHYKAIQTTVPTARCVLTKQSFKLCDFVIDELKLLQKNLLEGCDEQTIHEGCLIFFQKYGTHVNLGEVHFGGRYTWEARYSGVERDAETVGTMVDNALTDSILGNAITQDVDLSSSQQGGPDDFPSFELWKIGLLANSSSWVLIDRTDEYVAIWDIMTNDDSSFEDVIHVSNMLKHAWVQLNSNEEYYSEQGMKKTDPNNSRMEHIKSNDGIQQTNTIVESIEPVREASVLHTMIMNPDITIELPGPNDGKGENPEVKDGLEQSRYTDCDKERQILNSNSIEQTDSPDIGLEETTTPENGPQDVEPPYIPTDKKKDLLQILCIKNYYPEKISMDKVMTVGNDLSKEQAGVENMAWNILRKLIMLDNQSISSELNRTVENSTSGNDSDFWDFADISDITGENDEINPLDLFLAIFSCCDLNLRQILVQKMHLCRLAVPFIFPGIDTQSLTYSLWALRTTILNWRNAHEKAIESSAVNSPIHLVSCIRLQRPGFSKSKLLNEVISDQSHQTFINIDCPNGNVNRVAADGLVEASFFLPNGENTNFKNVTMFLNLRGDGIQHVKQVDLLSKIANVIVICLDISDLNHVDTIKAMKNIHRQSQKVVFVFSDRQHLPNRILQQHLQQFTKSIGTTLSPQVRRVFAFIGNKNASQLKCETRNAIRSTIVGQDGIILEDVSHMITALGFEIDEVNDICQEGKFLANEVMKCINQITNNKTDVLPVQGKHWKAWCKLLKMKKRSRHVKNQESSRMEPTVEAMEEDQDNSIQDVAKIEKKMDDHRKEQDKLCNHLSFFMSAFSEGLEQTIDTPIVLYYLQWLKMFLDDRCRHESASLMPMYHKKLKRYRDLKSAASDTSTIVKEIKSIEDQIENVLFGMEHMMREIGQIYEAAIDSNNIEHQQTFQNLPCLAAKLLLRGQALELLDGDASGVPIIWLKAVFTQLEKQVGKTKLFCLSVVGIQSSGKSTLLNTMFGLQFPVSAGRCTRGVFMQLVKVATGSDLPFDYVAVIDSEGIRAPEIGESKLDHDNELATFVIGLGSLTALNIKGENVTEVKDILQIVSHAFLRMKMVNECIQKARSCVFIHQNVPAVNAEEMMIVGTQRLQDALDNNTKEAAELENIVGIHSFNQIIRFDNQKSVWYFPDLWTGNPPMAYVNRGYHEEVKKLKSSILNEHSNGGQSCLSFSQMKDLIKDMWHGVLADDFVFGFRNSLVIKTYNSLEEKFAELKWELELSVLDWLNKVQWENYCSQDNLDSNGAELKNEVFHMIHTKEKDIVSRLERFINNDSQRKAIMDTWKGDKVTALHYASKTQCRLAKKTIDDKIAERSVNLLKYQAQKKHEEEILAKAEKLAADLKDKNLLTPCILNKHFEKMWDEWIRKLSHHQEGHIPIGTDFVALLYELFPSATHLVQDALQKKSIDKRQKEHGLVGSFTKDNISNKDLSFSQRVFFSFQPVANNSKIKIVEALDDTFRRIDSYLTQLCKKKSQYQIHDAKEVIEMVRKTMKHLNSSPEKLFSIPTPFEVKIIVHVCRYAIPKFEQLQAEYDEKWSSTAQLKEYKQTTMNLFMNLVMEKSKEVIVADMICDQLVGVMLTEVQKFLQLAVVKEIVKDFGTKSKLIKAMLHDMAEKELFSTYKSYISDAKLCALNWITNYTDKYIFNKRLESCWYADKGKEHVEGVVNTIKEAIEEASALSKEQKSSCLMWVKTLMKKMSSVLSLNNTHIVNKINEYKVQDVGQLKNLMLQRIDIVKSKIYIKLEDISRETIKWTDKTPYVQVIEAIWGCKATCPFCSEPCLKADPDHGSTTDCHSCIQHRPKGINYMSHLLTKKLVVTNCSYDVQLSSVASVVCLESKCPILLSSNTTYHFHKYNEYKSVYPEWEIPPSSDMDSSKYWMWYFNKFKHEIAAVYKEKLPDIPESWETITKKGALDSLYIYD